MRKMHPIRLGKLQMDTKATDLPFKVPQDTLESVLIAYEGKDSCCETKRFFEGVRG